jgi:peptidoglycan hydrolase CwlO-like protein
MVAIAFNRLYMTDVYDTLCPPEIKRAIPDEIAKTVLDIEFSNVDLYVAPQETFIGTLRFERGILLKGTVSFWGLSGSAEVRIDQARGALIHAEIDPINLAGVFTLTGGTDGPKALLHIDLRTGEKPGVNISGAVELLGIEREVQLEISDEGFHFLTRGRLFDLFEASLEVYGGNLSSGAGIFVRATMQNDLLAYLRDEATKAIQAAAKEVTSRLDDAKRSVETARNDVNVLNLRIDGARETVRQERERDATRLREAQQAVADAQTKVASLDVQIDAMRATVQSERDRDAGRLRDAQTAVQSAQGQVDSLDTQIAAARQTVAQERWRDSSRLRDAQNAVTNAQGEVQRLQDQIDDCKRYIDQLNRDIEAKKQWYGNQEWLNKTWAWAELGGYVTGKGAEVTAMYTKIGGIEAGKHIAIGTLELARQTLRGMELAATQIPVDADLRVSALIGARTSAFFVLEGAKQTLRGMELAATGLPIDADVRVVGLVGARESASGILEGTRQTVRGMELAALTIPVDADPRVSSLIALRETANAGLTLAELTLDGVKQGVTMGADFADQVVRFGLGGLIDIKSAVFEASLSSASGGRVSISLGLSFMDNPQQLDLEFDFNDLAKSVEGFVKKLLPDPTAR